MSRRYVLDASALLCLIRGEDGADTVAAVMPDAAISAVNLSEAVAKLADVGMDAATVAEVLSPLRLDVASLDEEAAVAAGMLRPITRAAGLSLGDRACIALAQTLEAEAVTADRAWSRVEVGVQMKWIR